MAIDKALYQAPQGLGAIVGAEPDIEIEIEDPEALRISVEGEEIFDMDDAEDQEDFNKNLAEEMDGGDGHFSCTLCSVSWYRDYNQNDSSIPSA